MSGHHQLPKGHKGANSPPPIGRCIYCDSTEGLSKEHIIPQSLRGKLTLLKASCSRCQEITRDFERRIARDVFQDVRAVDEFRRKEHPGPIPLRSGPEPDAPITHHVSQADAPRFLGLFAPEIPGIIEGRPRGSSVIAHRWFRVLRDDEEMKRRRRAKGLPHDFYRDFNHALFGQFLAKIAIGLAVYFVGLESFDPSDIRKIVLGEDNRWSYLIGGTTEKLFVLGPLAVPEGHGGHRATLFAPTIGEVPYVAAQIQLFGNLETPIYTVVVGELLEAGLDKFREHHSFYA